MLPAIVVNAFNRPRSLARLLASLRKATYPVEARVPLVISIDGGGSAEVRAIAQDFDWRFGDKQVIAHDRHLGLVPHFFACGDLTRDYGSIVYLEDDLYVSPVFYTYAARALEFFDRDERIAGASLYSLWFNGYTQQPFVPLADGSDVFFLQVPYTQGLAFTREQWARFTDWRSSSDPRPTVDAPLHEAWSRRFRADEWFPILTRYVVAHDRFFVYPRTSLTTGFGDAGAHFASDTSFFQAPLQRTRPGDAFVSLDDSLAVYDSFFEILPERLKRLVPDLRSCEYAVDLYATKTRENLPSEYVLTTRRCVRALALFGKTMWPMEANVIESIPGDGIHLCRKEDLRWDRLSNLATWYSNHAYYSHGRGRNRKTWLKLAVAAAARSLRLGPFAADRRSGS